MSLDLSQERSKLFNETLFEKLASRDPVLEKEAIDDVNDFTRTKMREDGFMRRILPPVQITNDELDRQYFTDKLIKVVDKEPDSPAAVSVGFGTLPVNIYIRGNKYPVMLDRILTPNFTKDVDELRTWIMDIRQVLSDNAIKDMLAEEDGKFLASVRTAMGGTVDVAATTSGKVQWKNMNGPITRDSLWDMMKILPQTPTRAEVQTCLVNNITIKEICKFNRTEMGGDLSQDIMKNGWTEQNFMNVRWIITIKQDLVPNGYVYMFADPRFVGRHYMLEDTVLHIKRERFMLEFGAYQTSGATIGNTNSVACAVFNM